MFSGIVQHAENCYTYKLSVEPGRDLHDFKGKSKQGTVKVKLSYASREKAAAGLRCRAGGRRRKLHIAYV